MSQCTAREAPLGQTALIAVLSSDLYITLPFYAILYVLNFPYPLRWMLEKHQAPSHTEVRNMYEIHRFE